MVRSPVPKVDSRLARRFASNRNGSSSSSAFDFPVHLNEVTRTYFERSAAITPGKMGEAMRALAKKTLPTLQQHLKDAQSLEAKLAK